MTREVVIIDVARSAVGKRNGALSSALSTELLGDVLVGLFARNPTVDPAIVGHVVGGCVNQLGIQSGNIARTAWLAAGLPMAVPAVTVNNQCGSSQEALTLSHGLIAGGLVDAAVACGVEVMSRVPLGSPVTTEPAFGYPRDGRYSDRYEPTSQFEGAERIAERWDLTRDDLEQFGLRSQRLAAQAWHERRFSDQIVPIHLLGTDRGATTSVFDRDEGLRETSLRALATLRPNLPDRTPGFHTAGTTSQVSDGAAAALLMSAQLASELGLEPRARLVDSILVGSDPVLMLTGPIAATQSLLVRTAMTIDDIDVFEVNEAFASVVLAWQRELHAPMEKVNVNGGAIALGHPLGATGVFLVGKAIFELERAGDHLGLVTMCCGGGVATGTILERL